jgi:AcrR family transcriptional regulator
VNVGRGERTRQQIIERAAPLFNRQGYEGASLSDIMAATGLQKGGIYRHFESKEELALRAFDHATAIMAERFATALREQRTAPDRLRAIIGVFRDLVTDSPIPGGCPVVNTAIEADDGNPALRARARAAMDGLRAMIRRTAEGGIARGELRADTDPDALATVLISTMEGGVVMSRLCGDRVHVDRAADHLERWIEERVCR